jgi:AcrR family transcriptional regulator
MMAKTTARRRPKGDKRQRTRARLIEAAAQVIGEKGWDRTSLDEVARRAGMTRGAIYGNFLNREELFLAVVQARWKPVIPPIQERTTFQAYMRALGTAVAAATTTRHEQAVGALSFMLYALTHEEMRSRVETLNGELYGHGAKRLASVFHASELPMSPARLLPIIHALTDGLTFLRFMTPELITDDVVIAAFEALGGQRRGNRPRRRGRSRTD